MRFDMYLNNRSQEIVVAVNRKGFGYFRAGEAKATNLLHEVSLFIAAALQVPRVLACYLLTCAGILKPPAPELEIINAQQAEAQHGRKSKAARKVGFQPPSAPGTVIQ
jgi:hypothetical protein